MVRKTGDLANESPDQLQRFKALARELECDEDEAAFDEALKQIADVRPLPQHKPKKRPSSA